MDALRRAVLETPGTIEPAMRRACAEATALAEPIAGYVDTIARHAYRLTDDHVARLRTAGYSEDAIFEATVAAALGAGLRRLDAGLRALGGDA